MAGGMVLLGVLLAYLDVASAMILFSIIQLFANGGRVVAWRAYVLWPIFGRYVVVRPGIRRDVDDRFRADKAMVLSRARVVCRS